MVSRIKIIGMLFNDFLLVSRIKVIGILFNVVHLQVRLDFHRPIGPPQEDTLWGRSAGSFPEQRLVIEPTTKSTETLTKSDGPHNHSQSIDYHLVD